ncbi:MAG: hypothetical protein ACRERD_02740, partial [Candidatus Binatia bacterium]
RDLGYIRPDGKTLIAQPWLDREHMWTVEDLRSCHYITRSPLHDAPIITGEGKDELIDQAKL